MFARYEDIKSKGSPLIPIAINFCFKTVWFTVSKAFFKSRKIPQVILLLAC